MNNNDLKMEIINEIFDNLKETFLSITEEEPNKVPIFTFTLNMFEYMDSSANTHLIKNIDDKLFDKLINEIVSVLN